MEASAAGAEGEAGMGVVEAVARERTRREVRGIIWFWGSSGAWGESGLSAGGGRRPAVEALQSNQQEAGVTAGLQGRRVR